MAMKLIIFKIFVAIVVLNNCESRSPPHLKHTLVHESDEVNQMGNQSTAPGTDNSLNEYFHSSINAAKRVMGALPSPKQILHYGKQALIGVPEEIASGTKRFLCSKVVSLNDIVKEFHPESEDLNYEFLTQDQDNVTIALSDSEYLFNHPKFHMNWNVVLFVSDWNSNTSQETISALYDAYRCRTGYNFVVLDTSKFVSSMYAWSELSTEPIGQLIGDAISNLTRFVPYERIHLIGNGIGAHIAGMAGRYFSRLTGNALPRITGLDPWRPCFSESDRSNGLQRGDALFVDIIHSNIALWSLDPIGDVDFFPNGPDIIQPDCWSTSCSANRAYQFYAKTIYPENEYSFNATKKCETFSLFRMGNCNNFTSRIPLGIATPNWARGKFYLPFPITDLHVPDKKRCNDF